MYKQRERIEDIDSRPLGLPRLPHGRYERRELGEAFSDGRCYSFLPRETISAPLLTDNAARNTDDKNAAPLCASCKCFKEATY